MNRGTDRGADEASPCAGSSGLSDAGGELPVRSSKSQLRDKADSHSRDRPQSTGVTLIEETPSEEIVTRSRRYQSENRRGEEAPLRAGRSKEIRSRFDRRNGPRPKE